MFRPNKNIIRDVSISDHFCAKGSSGVKISLEIFSSSRVWMTSERLLSHRFLGVVNRSHGAIRAISTRGILRRVGKSN